MNLFEIDYNQEILYMDDDCSRRWGKKISKYCQECNNAKYCYPQFKNINLEVIVFIRLVFFKYFLFNLNSRTRI